MRNTTESPIEDDFLQAFLSLSRGTVLVGASVRDLVDRAEAHPGSVFVGSQVQVGKYRADFIVTGAPVGWNKTEVICVECDGKEFHSGREAIERDRRRDYHFACRGIHTMRFSGSRLWSDPFGCARDVFSELGIKDGDQEPRTLVDILDTIIDNIRRTDVAAQYWRTP